MHVISSSHLVCGILLIALHSKMTVWKESLFLFYELFLVCINPYFFWLSYHFFFITFFFHSDRRSLSLALILLLSLSLSHTHLNIGKRLRLFHFLVISVEQSSVIDHLRVKNFHWKKLYRHQQTDTDYPFYDSYTKIFVIHLFWDDQVGEDISLK